MKFSSLAALKVVKMTTSSAASDENFVKMTTFPFQCCSGLVQVIVRRLLTTRQLHMSMLTHGQFETSKQISSKFKWNMDIFFQENAFDTSSTKWWQYSSSFIVLLYTESVETTDSLPRRTEKENYLNIFILSYVAITSDKGHFVMIK